MIRTRTRVQKKVVPSRSVLKPLASSTFHDENLHKDRQLGLLSARELVGDTYKSGRMLENQIHPLIRRSFSMNMAVEQQFRPCGRSISTVVYERPCHQIASF